MPGGAYFPARKNSKYYPWTCQGHNSVSLQAPKSHLSSFGICKQSVTPCFQAWPDMHFQRTPLRSGITQSTKLSKKNDGESLVQSIHAAYMEWGFSLLSKGSLSALQALVSSNFCGWSYSSSWRCPSGRASQEVIVGSSGEKSRREIKCNQHGWKLQQWILLNWSESYPISLAVLLRGERHERQCLVTAEVWQKRQLAFILLGTMKKGKKFSLSLHNSYVGCWVLSESILSVWTRTQIVFQVGWSKFPEA